MGKVTINCDMGEAFGIYRFGDDEACMPFVTHANVACGFHASDPVVMWKTVRAAKTARHQGRLASRPAGSRGLRAARNEARRATR